MAKHQWKSKEDSYYKMIVWFVDGNVRTFYSLDWESKYSRTRDAALGLQRLVGLMRRFGKSTKTVMFYKKESGEIIAKYIDGIRVETDSK